MKLRALLRGYRPGRLLLVGGILLVPVLAFRVPVVQRALLALIEVMRTTGWYGAALFALVYALGGSVAAPIALFNILAGYVYGPVKGVLLASPACVLAASVGFFLGRTVLHRVVQRKLQGNHNWDLLEAVIERDGLKVTTLIRMTPIVPQNFFPFAAGTTRLRYRDFALATWVGLFPISCLHALAGSQFDNAAAIVRGEQQAGTSAIVAPIAALLVSVVMIVLVTRVAKRQLDAILSARRAEELLATADRVVTSDRTG